MVQNQTLIYVTLSAVKNETSPTRKRFRSFTSPRTFTRARKSRFRVTPSSINTHRCDGKLQKHPRYVQRGDDVNYVDDFRRIFPFGGVRFGGSGLFHSRLSSPVPASCCQSLTFRHNSRLVVPSKLPRRVSAVGTQTAPHCIYIVGRAMTCGPVNFLLADCRDCL